MLSFIYYKIFYLIEKSQLELKSVLESILLVCYTFLFYIELYFLNKISAFIIYLAVVIFIITVILSATVKYKNAIKRHYQAP